MAFWIDRLGRLPGLAARPLPDWTGNPITRVELAIDAENAGLHAWETARRLMARDPAVAVRDDLAEHGVLHLDPCNVTAEEAEAVAAAIAEEFASARARGDGPGPSWIEVKRGRARPTVPWLEAEA
jgi:D-glucosaminate-6-phosphate ammonia-lyase